MVAFAKNMTEDWAAANFRARFEALLPELIRGAQRGLQAADAQDREQMVEKVLAAAYAIYVGLSRRGKADLAYPTPLVNAAIKLCSRQWSSPKPR